MSEAATHQEGAKDKPTDKEVREQVQERIQQQGPRARDEMASFLADKHREQRDHDLIENQKENGIEEPVLPDTKSLKKDEDYPEPENPEVIRQRELEAEPIPGVTDKEGGDQETDTPRKAVRRRRQGKIQRLPPIPTTRKWSKSMFTARSGWSQNLPLTKPAVSSPSRN